MKKSLLAIRFLAFSLSAKTTRLKTYCCIAIVLLAGCTSTQVRWDATNIRKEVMVYYNDQIMDNLVRAKYHLPFVHVDITLLTSQGMSQITGTIGAGESGSNTNASKSMTGMLGTVTNAVMRPFAWSVSPQQSETVSIQAAPALGSQTQWSPVPTAGRTPKPITIYDLYENFANSPHFSSSATRPDDLAYVSGTLKRWEDGQYYYIRNNDDDKEAYYKFCKKLFMKGQAAPLEKKLTEIQSSAALPH
jgi:hypothetical protein